MPPRKSTSSQAPAPAASQPDSVQIHSVHKMAFIQAMMASSVMPEHAAKEVMCRICGSSSDAAYAQIVSQANEEMLFAGFQLKTLKSPADGVKYLGFINKDADLASKLGSKFSVAQREFFRAVVEFIARAPGPVGKSSMTELLNLEVTMRAPQGAGDQAGADAGAAGGSQAPMPQSQAPMSQAPQSQAAAAPAAAVKQLSKKDRESTLQRLLSEEWLGAPPDKPSYYCLGVRTLMELGDFLLNLEGLPQETKDAFDDLL